LDREMEEEQQKAPPPPPRESLFQVRRAVVRGVVAWYQPKSDAAKFNQNISLQPCNCTIYEGRLQSLWTHLINSSRSSVEVR
jgi:hypothetical protein